MSIKTAREDRFFASPITLPFGSSIMSKPADVVAYDDKLDEKNANIATTYVGPPVAEDDVAKKWVLSVTPITPTLTQVISSS